MNSEKISEIIKLAKLKLFTNELIFFGMNLNKFNWVVNDYSPMMEGFVIFKESDLNELEFGNIYLNNYYLSKDDYTYINLAFLLCHELLHILNKHGLRRGDRIHHVWCIAADHVVDSYLKQINNLIRPHQDKYNIIKDLSRDIPNCTTEQAYNWLIKNQENDKIKIKTSRIDNNANLIEVFDQNNEKIIQTTDQIPGAKTENGQSQQVEQFISEARALFEIIKQKGNIPGSMISYLDNLLKVEIPWERILEKSIKTSTIVKPDERTWRVLNKNYFVHNLTIPGYSLVEDKETTGTLILCVDSSGSITNKNLQKFSSVIVSSSRYFKEIHVLVHDILVHQHKIFNKDNIHSFSDFLKNEGYKGRGGTSHEKVFTEIENEFWNKDRDELSMVICLTDGYSDIEYIYTKFNWIKNNLPLIFILTESSSRTLILDSTIGDITIIKMN